MADQALPFMLQRLEDQAEFKLPRDAQMETGRCENAAEWICRGQCQNCGVGFCIYDQTVALSCDPHRQKHLAWAAKVAASPVARFFCNRCGAVPPHPALSWERL